ncbi:TA system VapC family ribonuclease toxin [Vandammella animalimorsus]|uniref:Ribonuclease VapC n=1 Tax=Vandammella animalimorsus TaxID=2029117 RepID=A0A2A2AAA4_9BURK|nr:TA system VapC family ribonuclease toxin [Vandammella animalimorsus]PAT34678.1 VapC toxin family PIN domain ribonuclease [Vandammella animalimorsus]
MPATSRRLLLDVNVWVALLDEQHVHNQTAIALWQRPGLRIATCPLTENGALRICAMPGLGRGRPASLATIRAAMQRACGDVDHQFWPDALSLIGGDALDFNRISGHNQITDAYLLALAVHHGGTLASFDQRIALSAVRGATSDHLLLL